jgi:hypothetical protein
MSLTKSTKLLQRKKYSEQTAKEEYLTGSRVTPLKEFGKSNDGFKYYRKDIQNGYE